MTTEKTVGGRVFKRGKIFQCGDYPDKGVNVDIATFRASNLNFTPVALNIEHSQSVFDDHLGELVGIETADDGAVFGLLSVPTPVNDLLKVKPQTPVSIEIDQVNFAVTGLAFVKFPRVTDAAVFNALGIDPPKEKQKMNWKEKLANAVASFGAAVAEMPDDVKVETPAKEKPAEKAPDPAAETDAVKAERVKREAAEAELAAMKAKEATDNAAREEVAVNEAAEKFALHYANDRRIRPTQLESTKAQYKTLLRADNAGKACFSADGKPTEGEAVKAFRALLEQTPQHNLTLDTMGQHQFKSVSGDHGEKGVSPDRKAVLMSKSALGRRAVATKGK